MLLATRYWRNDLVGVYTGVAAGYALLCVLFQLVVVSSDWRYWAEKAAERAEQKQAPPPDAAAKARASASINAGDDDPPF